MTEIAAEDLTRKHLGREITVSRAGRPMESGEVTGSLVGVTHAASFVSNEEGTTSLDIYVLGTRLEVSVSSNHVVTLHEKAIVF